MTNLTNRLMIAAATMVVAAGAASAQTMKAEIPFAFRVGTATMSPGTYRVEIKRSAVGVKTLHVSSADTGHSVMAAALVTHDADKAWVAGGKPMLAFECAGNRCALSEVWSGLDSRSAYHFATPKPGVEPVHVALVELVPTKGD